MQRYHKKIYFPDNDNKDLIELINELNQEDYSFSIHCLDNIKDRLSQEQQKDLLLKLKNTVLNKDKIFEYYKENNIITKICLRDNFDNRNDYVLVLSKDKNIITIYLNVKEDEHFTLKEGLYNKEGLNYGKS
jgi:hypothetical protein